MAAAEPDEVWAWNDANSGEPVTIKRVRLDGTVTAGPVVLSRFGTVFGADGPGAILLQGSGGLYRAVIDGPSVAVERVSPTVPLAYSSGAFLQVDCDDGLQCHLAVVDRATGTARIVPGDVIDRVVPSYDNTLSADGRWLVNASYENDPQAKLDVYDLTTGELVMQDDVMPRAYGLLGTPQSAEFTPDGQWLVYFNLSAGIRLWKVGSADKPLTFDVPRDQLEHDLAGAGVTGKGTPATTAVSRAGIDATVHDLGHLDGDGGYGRAVATALAVAPERVFKTLVVRADGDLAVAVVPVTGEADLKAVAAALGAKRAALAERRRRRAGHRLRRRRHQPPGAAAAPGHRGRRQRDRLRHRLRQRRPARPRAGADGGRPGGGHRRSGGPHRRDVALAHEQPAPAGDPHVRHRSRRIAATARSTSPPPSACGPVSATTRAPPVTSPSVTRSGSTTSGSTRSACTSG